MSEETVDWKGVAVFVTLAFAIAWALFAPVWVSGVLSTPSAVVWMSAMMLAPGIAALVVVSLVSPTQRKRPVLGVQLGHPRWWKYWLAAWLGTYVICLAAPFVGALSSWYELDLVGFAHFRSVLAAAGSDAGASSIENAVLVQLVVGLMLPPFANALFALGEELGWRGYLLPSLLPLGPYKAIAVSSAMWGIWHAPAIYLGYNYPLHPELGIGLMIVLCLIFGTLLSWLRLACDSVWPPVIAHAMLNGAGGLSVLFAAREFDSALVGVTGITGWILPLLIIGYLYASGRLAAAPSGVDGGSPSTN